MGRQRSQSAETILGWTNSRFGPLGELRQSRLALDEGGWWFCSARLARFPIGNPFSLDSPSSAGTSLEREQALWRAAGEAIERYTALNGQIDGRPATLRETGFADHLPRCAPDEPCPSSLQTLPLDTKLTMVAVRRLAGGPDVLLPAGFVHLDFWPEAPEPLVTLPISTGLAFQTNLYTAIWTGLCEVIERDAVMMFWWCNSRLREIDFDGASCVSEGLTDRLNRLQRAGIRARLFDMKTDIQVPSVFCVGMADSYPHLVVSASCRADPAQACMKALDEIVALRLALRSRRAETVDHPTPTSIRRLEDHAALYADKRSLSAFDFLLSQPGLDPLPFDEFVGHSWWRAPLDLASLSQFARKLEELQLTVLWADLTIPDAANLGHVVKVIVPEMVPLSPDDAIRWLATPRLLRRAGLTEARASHFNRAPHPFA